MLVVGAVIASARGRVGAGYLVGWSAAAQTPDQLYGDYITPETQSILERHEQAMREVAAAEAAARARKTLILAVSGLIPVGVIGLQILKEKNWKDNPGGTVRALGTAFAGGLVIFGLNYGVLYLKFKYGDAFNTALAFLIVAGLIVGCIYLLRGK